VAPRREDVRIATDEGVALGELVDDGVNTFHADPVDRDRTCQEVGLGAFRLLGLVVPSKIVAVGRNHLAHVLEMGYRASRGALDLPQAAFIDHRTGCGRRSTERALIRRPARSRTCGRDRASRPPAVPSTGDGPRAGLHLRNDVTARDLQRRDPSITRAKSFDTFCSIGPWVETDFDPSAGSSVRCWVDDELWQEGQTSDLIIDIPTVLSFISQVMTLEPGDVVLTGSPGGTSTMRHGQAIRIEIEGIGSLQHGVRSASDT
jgi:2-keto-4-pentenoate hydratase/2-oxohepta-3-ene-1,7-dioic acid hydratase in catechol pathway